MIYKSYTLRFVLHRRNDTPRQHLQMRLTLRGGKPLSFATGITLMPNEWDAYIGMAKGRTPAAAEANSLISKWSRVVEEMFTHYDSLNIVPTTEQLRKDFARLTKDETAVPDYTPQASPQMTLQAAFLQFIVHGKENGGWSQGTVNVMLYYRRLLSCFKPDITLNKIDQSYMEAFHKWMVETRHQQGVSVNGNLVKMRWFLRWARRKGLYNGTVDIDYRPKVKGASEKTRSIVYLTRDELKTLEAHEFAEKHYAVAKDVFLFACYTGLRWSDVVKLTKAECFDDHIQFITKKTNHALTIPLNDKAKTILDKYADCGPNRKQKMRKITNPALPSPDIKTMNLHLRHIMQAAGITVPTTHTYYIGNVRYDEVRPKCELVTTHTARHTFIVTAISLGVPIPVLMDWTGHRNYESLKSYIAIANATSVSEMQRFNTL